MTERYEVLTFLGPAAEELTDEQIDTVMFLFDDIDARYPDVDDYHLRTAAYNTVVQYLLNEVTAENVNRALIAARLREEEAYAAALQYAVTAVRVDGEPKATAARDAGIDRMSLLKALGER